MLESDKAPIYLTQLVAVHCFAFMQFYQNLLLYVSTESVVMIIISITFIALYSKYTNRYSSREMSFIKRVRD